MKKLKLCLLLIGLGDCCIAASSTMPIDEVQQRHLRNGMSTATGEASASRETVVHTVTNVPGPVAFDFKSADHKLVADTMHQTEYPEDIGDPLFWFDCRQTNGWTFAANGEVAKIPNLTDDGRYLSTDTEGGIHGNA